ncbi:MAG: oligopeptide transport system permease protein [Chloroflexota bacterium]|jgi:oligopeptide transport system permease protein|nr:oligopeptide transport system permease protein [Chloroflexota bacterium]
MGRFLARRLLWIVLVLFCISLITFALMHSVPGGPWDAEKQLAPSVVENLNRRYNLDKPIYEQYARFLVGALHGDLGVSYSNQDRNVTTIILDGFPITATLGVCGIVLALLLGISLGTVGALRQGSALDHATLLFATAGASVPNIVAGILLIIIFALTLHWFPTGGWQSPAPAWDALLAGRPDEALGRLWTFLSRVVMPALALAFTPAALLARITRASVLEIIRQDFVRTAWAKGLSESGVVWQHVLKNALIPVITLAGPIAADLITGSFIVESIFGIPGIGRNLVQAIFARDYALVLGAVLFYTLIIAIANLLVDVLYAVVDPRIRYG